MTSPVPNAAVPDHLQSPFLVLDSQYETLIAKLQLWCNQNSGSYNRQGLSEMLSLLEAEFASLGVESYRLPTKPFRVIEDDGNATEHQTTDLLIAEYRPEAARRILLMIHYDTVYPPGANPDRCTLLPDGRMIGPGTADAKGGLLIMLEAIRTVHMYGLDNVADFGWTMIANPDEEIGSLASSGWMKENAKGFQLGLLFEPPLPNGSLVSRRKGSGNFNVIVEGRSAHAGRNIEAGRNAITHLCKLLAEIDQINHMEHSLSDGFGNGTTVNVAKVHGGLALNRVPDWAMGRFNVRVPDESSQHIVLDQIKEIAHKYDVTEGYKVTLDGEFQSPPKPLDEATSRLQQIIERAGAIAGRGIQWQSTGGACDGSKLAAAGLPNIDTLGPGGDNLHSPQEWVDTHSIIPAIKTVVAIIDAVAQSTHVEPV